MSKIETVKNLNDSADQLEIVKAVADLRQSLEDLKVDLAQLPAAVSHETATALKPLESEELSETIIRLQEASASIGKLPANLTRSAQDLKTAAAIAKPHRFRHFFMMMMAALIAAALVGPGRDVFAIMVSSEPEQSREEQAFQRILSNATPNELELIEEIIGR